MSDYSRYPKGLRAMKDFRHVKGGPETPKPHPRKKTHKPWIVEMSPTPEEYAEMSAFFRRWYPLGEWQRWGRYETERDAQNAMSQVKHGHYHRQRFNYRVRKEE